MAATNRILPLKLPPPPLLLPLHHQQQLHSPNELCPLPSQLLRLLKQTLLRRRLRPDLPLHLQLQQRRA
jgi:hypothetical protein